ncbi:MAG: class I SAM-dependent methyltransferase [candidate division KSB1 bacterium]|nr:class I SAM-dependent methyltransferase [candidate division KSB1 bacterium]MDZ7335258.1 class I SAM-dependent methyltransferase [candidate division KSB1 bacterium]MDZ7357992.1 class I SAM-dependent methyltransferase [candidate division KSB1 bacterium]MDZ7399795.1 class I SAM-dependent methyltransferase [candidate division KSB1 bacterium]
MHEHDENNNEVVPPYSKLAYIYDELMSYVDYKNWGSYIEKIIERWNPNARTILDISCGTGNLLMQLNSKKYQLYGSDLSFEMLKVAQHKLAAANRSISIWQSSMCDFCLRSTIDVIISLYDSVNYLLKDGDWMSMLESVYQSLQSQGLFIFDICTEQNSKRFFQNYFEKNRGEGYWYTRASSYDRNDRIHTNRFEIYLDEHKKTFIEVHRQRILHIAEVQSLIKQTDFKLLQIYDGLSFRPGSEHSLRVHFVLRKEP